MATSQDRGWGPGYPNCQRDRLVSFDTLGIGWVVREEIAELTKALVSTWHARVERLDPAQCWSFACRAIRGGTSPSNHSWGLAVDLNSAVHPLGQSGTFSPAQVQHIRAILAEPHFRHFRWGGDYATRPDEMHLEYLGTPADAAADTALLRDLEDDMTETDQAIIADIVREVVRAEMTAALRFTITGKNNSAYTADRVGGVWPHPTSTTVSGAPVYEGTITLTPKA